jgi:hypothetical protein
MSPCQVVQYCAFFFDTHEVLVLCQEILLVKREQALTIMEYLLANPERKWSKLSLAVAAGIFEFLEGAAPWQLAHTYLQCFHTLVHLKGLEVQLEPFLTQTSLPADLLPYLH